MHIHAVSPELEEARQNGGKCACEMILMAHRYKGHLSYDIVSEDIIKPCIKNDNPLVD